MRNRNSSSTNVINTLTVDPKHLEHRKYDSSGIAKIHPTQRPAYHRVIDKVNSLIDYLIKSCLLACVGISHNRKATVHFNRALDQTYHARLNRYNA